MKRILSLLLIASCVFSCVNPAAEQQTTARDSIVLNEPSPEAPTDFKTLDTALSFAGLWVNETYIDNIRKTRSPRQSQDVMESCITIPTRTLQVTRMIADFHEGAEDMVVVKDRNRYKLYDADLSTLQKEMELISPTRIKIGDQYFSRMSHRDTTLTDFGILEELLFSGRYERERGKEVVFTADGRIQGLDSFVRYSPVIDYTAGSLGEFDLINMGTGKGRDYGYRFKGDTLQIFRTICATPGEDGNFCDSVAAGATLYKLVRKKD
ncbi:MAG TPA: hypothetical protein VGD35_12330 [Chitinophaga sp.]